MDPGRIVAALVAFFVLTIIFVFFDPVIEDNIYEDVASSRIEDERAQLVADMFLNQWHWWVAPFIAAIFIYIITAGRTEDYPSRRLT